MVAELSALQQIVTLLTGLNGLPVVIVECAVTTIYTCTYSTLLLPSLPISFLPSSHINYEKIDDMLTRTPQPSAVSKSPS